MQDPDARRDPGRPATGAAAEIESLRGRRQCCKRKNPEIAVEQPTIFLANQSRLVVRGPFLAKTLDGRTVDIPGDAIDTMV